MASKYLPVLDGGPESTVVLTAGKGKLPLRIQSSLMLMRITSHTMIPPRGYSICGIGGSCGPWVDGLTISVRR